MNLNRCVPPRAAAALIGACLAAIAGCEPSTPRETSEAIDIRPSYPVRYATERISPAVVQLDVVTEEFSDGQLRAAQSIGSGFIIDKEGHVLTNFHVAGRAKRIRITLANQEHVPATLLGSDHWTDLALVQLDMAEITRRNLTFDIAPLGRSSEVTLGEPVMAVGTPYGLSRTVTSGIISNTDRFFDQTNIEGYETGWFNNWLQMDAAINPGNSGGPLINLRGEVIGINTRGYAEANSLGFAIPIDTAREVVPKLLAKKKVERSYIGVTLQPLQDLENFYELAVNQGVLVSNVEKNSPAADAGVQSQDILLAVNGKPVNARFPEQLASVRKLISDFPVGEKIDLTIRRGGAQASTSTTASSQPATTRSSDAATTRAEPRRLTVTTDKLESIVTEERAIADWGLTVRDLTHAYLRGARQPVMDGVLVTGARSGSAASRAGLQYGDIILKIDNKKVTSADELATTVSAVMKARGKEHTEILIDIYHNRGPGIVTINP